MFRARVFCLALLPGLINLCVILSPALAGSAPAARNPLYAVPGGDCQDMHGDMKAVPQTGEEGPKLTNIQNGDYALYKGFDFDSGIAAFRADVASTGNGRIEVRLDKPDGPLLATCNVKATGGAEKFKTITCKADNSQAGVRDIYLAFTSEHPASAMALRSFVFLKSSVAGGPPTDVSGRVDKVDDEPQAQHAWGMPEAGFSDNFSEPFATNWTGKGFTAVDHGVEAKSDALAYTPSVYINKTDTGGEWRTLAEASLAADITITSADARPGIGFSSVDGNQYICVTLDAADNVLQAFRHLADGSTTPIRNHPKKPNDPKRTFSIQTGKTYRLQLDWSPYSDALIVFLSDAAGKPITSFRTVIDLPAARRPMLINSGGPARFSNLKFDPHLDGWNFHWQWKKKPVLTPDVCNPAVWKWTDGQYYMVWRKFGSDTFHGVATSSDAVHWKTISSRVMKCTGDMNALLDPFGDGLVYITPGGPNLPWWTSDGSAQFTHWIKTNKTVGNIFGNNRIQEIVDTQKYKQIAPVKLNGKSYRFIAFTENWTAMPRPHTVVLLSNTLTDWVLASPDPVLPPRSDFWGEKGSAIGAASVLPDGNILLACCACTNEGYTGAPEPTNITAIADGKQPWKLLKLAVLPDAPVSRENVWYQGPNFGTAYLYEPASDTLFFYGGFHDSSIGMMRVQHFARDFKATAN